MLPHLSYVTAYNSLHVYRDRIRYIASFPPIPIPRQDVNYFASPIGHLQKRPQTSHVLPTVAEQYHEILEKRSVGLVIFRDLKETFDRVCRRSKYSSFEIGALRVP